MGHTPVSHLTPSLGVVPCEYSHERYIRGILLVISPKLESMCYQSVKMASSYTFIRFDTIAACDGRTDRQAALAYPGQGSHGPQTSVKIFYSAKTDCRTNLPTH